MMLALHPVEKNFKRWTDTDETFPYMEEPCVRVRSSGEAPTPNYKFCIGPERIHRIVDHLDSRDLPEVIEDGCGGVYLVGSKSKDPTDLAIFKPYDEEIESTGQMGFIREFAAYLIDDGMAGVPATGIACLPWGSKPETEGLRVGSIQEYMRDTESAADLGPALFNTEDIHRIGVLDIRILNCDRHSGNMLYCNKRKKLIPIDHGLSFPSASSDLGKASFDWLLYPGAKQPFSKALLREIEDIDVVRDMDVLKSLGMDFDVQLTLWMSTTLLKIAAASGKTLYEIGCMVQRQGDRSEPSVLEVLFEKALQTVKMYKVNFWSVFVECVYTYLNGICVI